MYPVECPHCHSEHDILGSPERAAIFETLGELIAADQRLVSFLAPCLE